MIFNYLSFLTGSPRTSLESILVEAAGVEPEMSAENTQLIDSEKVRIGMISRTAKSTVRSLYGHFPGPQLPNSTFGRPVLAKKAF
jgi:hypothetical protein